MFRNEGDFIEIIIRDSSGAKIESHKFDVINTKRAKGILNLIISKYGFGKSNIDKEEDRDIDWLKKQREW